MVPGAAVAGHTIVGPAFLPESLQVIVEADESNTGNYGQLINTAHVEEAVKIPANCLTCSNRPISEQVAGQVDHSNDGDDRILRPDVYSVMSSSCSDLAKCTFYYSQARTPTITSIFPVFGSEGTRVTITGHTFAPDNTTDTDAEVVTVMIGNAPCVVFAETWNDTAVECEVGSALAGSHPIVLTVPNKGDAMVDTGVTFTASVAVDSVFPVRGSHGTSFMSAFMGCSLCGGGDLLCFGKGSCRR